MHRVEGLELVGFFGLTASIHLGVEGITLSGPGWAHLAQPPLPTQGQVFT